jgi:HEAT repeat protein
LSRRRVLSHALAHGEPAGLAELRQHLRSDDARVRAAAMAHVCAHGAAARELAKLVARALEDPDPGVQYEATGAFRAIGRGAIDAVPDFTRASCARSRWSPRTTRTPCYRAS